MIRKEIRFQRKHLGNFRKKVTCLYKDGTKTTYNRTVAGEEFIGITRIVKIYRNSRLERTVIYYTNGKKNIFNELEIECI